MSEMTINTILLIIFIISLLFIQYAIIFMALIDNEYKGERKQLKRDLIPFLVYIASLKYLFELFLVGIKNIRKKIEETKNDGDKGVI